MNNRNEAGRHSRRSFLKEMAASSGALILVGGIGDLMAQIAPNWKNQIGLQLYTVGGLLSQDYEGTLAKLAGIGYKEVEASEPYNRMEPKQYKALLDKYGLKMFSTHSGATEGEGLEKQLEGFALMGIKYTQIGPPRRAGSPGGSAPGAGGSTGRGFQRPPQTEESVKRDAEHINKNGRIAQKFGMKILIHNHTLEFALLEGSKKTQYDVLLAETDPNLAAMELDIGWASIAGQNIIEIFQKNAGRYELWHVKDAAGFKNLGSTMTMQQRAHAAKIVPVGLGEINYATVFANAKLAGLKHFYIEQDGAGRESGDAMADCRVSYQNLLKILS